MSFNVSDIDITRSGWLTKQCKYSKKWKRVWFTLRASQLLYGDSEQGPFKPIPLHGTVIEECNVKGMKYVFRLRPPKSNRDYLIQAPDQTEEQMWMQAICFAKVGASDTGNSSLCIVQ
uniref:Uncharacterized protein LOC100177385 n=1 Tax=Phallusia mammillata TaxID=59560 RepID=A0A6F9DH74_9ASCI|nr:uncharacterized protein LOC100177385 [Phallusia mammillata]